MPVFDSTVAERCKARGCARSARRTWTSSRWARRPRTRRTGRRGTRGIPSASPAARREGRPRPWRPVSRRGRSAPTPAARSSSRPPCAASSGSGRPTARCPAPASSPSRPASIRSGRSRRPWRDCAFLYSVIAGRDPPDSTTVELPEPVEIPDSRGPEGAEGRCPEGAERGRGHRAGRERGGQRGDRALPRARRRGGGDDAPALGRVRPSLLLPDRSFRGLVEPRPLRRRALRPPRERRRRARDVHAHARRGLRRRAEASDHARHLRALGRLLRGVLRPGAEGADDHPGRVPRRARAVRPPRQPDLAHGRLPARREDRQPARDVPLRRPRDPAEHGRPARSLDPVRPVREPPGRPAADRPAVLREPALPRGPRARARARVRLRPAERLR